MSINKSQLYLGLCVAGLIPVALAYGVAPSTTVPFLFGFPADATNTQHIFRAVMGLYLALAALWTAGIIKPPMRMAALYCNVTFMWGLAAGRVLSLLLDGMPNALLLLYLALEFGFGAIGLWVIKQECQKNGQC